MTTNTPIPLSPGSKTAQRTSMGHRFLGALTRGPYRKFSGSRPPSRLRNRGLALPVLALLAALALGLLFLLPSSLLQAQENAPIDVHAENGEDPVATFTAEDPEGVTPIHWSVLADVDNFGAIDGVDTLPTSADFRLLSLIDEGRECSSSPSAPDGDPARLREHPVGTGVADSRQHKHLQGGGGGLRR